MCSYIVDTLFVKVSWDSIHLTVLSYLCSVRWREAYDCAVSGCLAMAVL